MNNSISALTDNYFYKAFANDTRNLLSNIGIDVYDIHVSLDLVVIYAFNGSMINRLDDNIINNIFDLYMKYNLRNELLATHWPSYEPELGPYKDEIANMDRDTIRKFFRIIVIKMVVSREEYTNYYNETVNILLALSRQEDRPRWLYAIGESITGAVSIEVCSDVLSEYGLSEKDVIEFLRSTVNNNYPSEIIFRQKCSNIDFLIETSNTNNTNYNSQLLYLIMIISIIVIICVILYVKSRISR